MGRQIVSSGYHQRSGKMMTLQLSGNCHPMERSWMEEVATGLPADRPLPDDGFRLTTGDVEGEWRTRALSIQASRSSPCSRLLPTALPTRLRAGWPADSPILQFFFFISCSSFISKLRL
ncbi:unnamed protein product [Spirodela intermedia]|uniref:Uncharacterized protein n=1 Tax=Spirodela intermedia TaxID=51605 RepID=A0A7I8IGV7_SPIIN|nr:unnamed protein product [Spirodela intermedia]CAA6657109.1 unnamed protein product [Spirodela intermedia]